MKTMMMQAKALDQSMMENDGNGRKQRDGRGTYDGASCKLSIRANYFGWLSALMMCIFVIGSFISLVLLLLALRKNTFRMVSEEISYIDAAARRGQLLLRTAGPRYWCRNGDANGCFGACP